MSHAPAAFRVSLTWDFLQKVYKERQASVHRVPWPFAPLEPRRWGGASPARLGIWYTYIVTVAAFSIAHPFLDKEEKRAGRRSNGELNTRSVCVRLHK